MKDLAEKVHHGIVPLDDEEIEQLSDDEIIEKLIQVKGIGRWTVHMFLIFRLGRPNVLPELDLGVQNAIRRAYRLRKQPGPKDVRRIGAKWSPHASIASWYLWRSLEHAPSKRVSKTTVRQPRAKRSPKKKARQTKRSRR